MKIAVIAHLRHPIAPPFMGGMEAHADLLVRALRDLGHTPTLFASADSDKALPLHPIAPRAYQKELPWQEWRDTPELRSWLTTAFARCWAAIRAGGFDIVHNNTLFPDLHEWAARDGVPMVTTLHVPRYRALEEAVAGNAAPFHLLTVPSRTQIGCWGASGGARLGVVPNGIDLARWPYDPLGGSRAIWFGRITPNKGTAEALRAAEAAGIGLDVAGPIDCGDYFTSIQPLFGTQHRYLGHLSGTALSAAVGAAAVALCTPIWDEPFGMVAAEALACGTPVAGLANGAIAEVVGDCGALVAHPDELAAAIGRARMIPRALCRARAEARFGARAMAEGFLPVYRAAMASASSMARTRAELA